MSSNVSFQTDQRAWPPDGLVIETEQQVGGEQRQVVKVGNTVPITVASLPLPSGAATATIQTDGTQKTKITDGTDVAEVIAGANTGVKGLRVYGGPTDPISDIPVVIEYDHHQVHEGESHGYSNLTASLAASSNKDFRINVPAGLDTISEACHLIVEAITTLETEIYLYEGMTYTVGNGGTARTSYNRNRLSLTAAATTIYEDPTAATTGTLLWIGLTGSGNRAGSGNRSLTEWVLKPGDYLVRATSRSNGDKVLIRFEWYEDLGV